MFAIVYAMSKFSKYFVGFSLMLGSRDVTNMLLEEYRKRKKHAYPNMIPATLEKDEFMSSVVCWTTSTIDQENLPKQCMVIFKLVK